ncbi:MAG: SDR family oxidoreductase [Gammaproteobacteria bacterium]|nr:SDR family oxidoreductase [Gammaproteobacteria bacterium]MDH4255398.1 SDR family oxidoreductase [Gammaproteobacteria bacterium]MDH5311339.1 SDR family oxidoreductase [Gammaproteobacteria bacterium]
MSMFDLSGKAAVITGGNGGIGLAMARALVDANCAVSIWGRNAAKLDSAVKELEARGGAVHALRCDVTDPACVLESFDAAVDRYGRIDGCFVNAGTGGGGRRSFLERSFEEWRRMLDVNLDAAFHVLQAAARHMAANAEAGQPGGRLVATSSIAALFGVARNEHYGASKAALNSLVRSLAVELARYGITANAILPGYSETEMTEGLFTNEKFRDAVIPRIPMRRFGKVEDFGGIAVYLMSDASAYHTADCFVIDGGYSSY